MTPRERELMEDFVYTNIDVYRRKWENAEQASEAKMWNWPAFLITPIWLAYRKMYGPSVLLFSMGIALTLIEILTGWILFYLMLPIFAYVGVQANKMYFAFVQRKVHQIGDRPDVLMQEGGVSAGKAFVITVAFWLLGVALGMMLLLV